MLSQNNQLTSKLTEKNIREKTEKNESKNVQIKNSAILVKYWFILLYQG